MKTFNNASRVRLADVRHELRAVAERALELCELQFEVVQGARSQNEQDHLYGKGRTGAQCVAVGIPATFARPGEAKVTWTRKSNHIGGKAIDVVPVIAGKINWDDSGKLGAWPKIADAFKRAAAELNIAIEWGGDWKSTKDRPHFELHFG